jgi:predicted CoA-binding protein
MAASARRAPDHRARSRSPARRDGRRRRQSARKARRLQGVTAQEVLRDATTIVLVDWPSRDVPDTLARAGYGVVVHGGPAPDDYSVYLVEKGQVVVRRTDPPEQADVVYSYRPLDELPSIVEQAQRLGARAVWVQLPSEETEAARLIVEGAGLTFVEGPYLPDAVRALGNRP